MTINQTEPFLKLKAYTVPDSLEAYQIALDCAFAAGRTYGYAEGERDGKVLAEIEAAHNREKLTTVASVPWNPRESAIYR